MRDSGPTSHRPLAGGVLPLLGSMTSLCVGSTFGKSLFPLAGAAGMTGLRNGLSALLMVVLLRPWRWRIGRRQALAATLYGLVLGTMNLFFYLALERLPVGIAIAIEFVGPLGLAVISSRRPLDFMWIAIAALGVALLVLPGVGGRPLDPLGIVFVLIAALGWALYIVTGQRVSGLMPGPQAVTLGLVAAGLLTLPIGIASAGRALLIPSVLGGGALVALLCSAIPYPLEMLSLQRLPRHVFGVIVSLEPAIGAVAGLVILGEHLSLLRWLAIGAVVVASCGITLTHRAPKAAPA